MYESEFQFELFSTFFKQPTTAFVTNNERDRKHTQIYRINANLTRFQL